MPADLLIIKKRGRKIQLKITQKMHRGFAPDNHTIVVNLRDFKDVALMLHDLEDLHNVPIRKAIEEYQSGRSKVWPF
jgi:hypothetical protein